MTGIGLESFKEIYQRACERKLGEQNLSLLISSPLTKKALLAHSDSLWLEAFTKKVFQSGFYWSVINAKWPGFKEVFWQFDIDALLMMSPEQLEEKSQDERIIRNFKKVQTIPHNCYMIYEMAQKHGSFAKFIADWPEDNIIGLWAELKKQGARLGGNTGPYALRAMGKDTFILSRDVESYLRAHKIVDGGLQTKKSLTAIQSFFNKLVVESGWSLTSLSQLTAYSVGDNYVNVEGNK